MIGVIGGELLVLLNYIVFAGLNFFKVGKPLRVSSPIVCGRNINFLCKYTLKRVSHEIICTHRWQMSSACLVFKKVLERIYKQSQYYQVIQILQ